jgi:hypothetical protein
MYQPTILTTRTESISPSYRPHIPTVSANHTYCTYRKNLLITQNTQTESISQSYRIHIPKLSAYYTDYAYLKYQPITRPHILSISQSYLRNIPKVSPNHTDHTYLVSVNHTDYTYRKHEYIHEHHAKLNMKVGSMYNATCVYSSNSNQQVCTSTAESINKCQN